MERIRILSNLANRNIYEYSDEDVREIFNAIEAELQAAKNRFEATQRRRPEFKLRSSSAVSTGPDAAMPAQGEPSK